MPKKYDFRNVKLAKFLESLASDSPTPGGGAGAALSGATGAALGEMTARINAKRAKKKDADAAPSLAVAEKLSKIRSYFLDLMGRDAEAFSRLALQMKKDRASPEYQACLGRCASVPMDICERAVAVMRLAEKEKPRTNKWLASDLAESGLLSYAAFVSGRLNVEINLKEMTDVAAAKKSRAKLDKLEIEADTLLKDILKVLGA